PNLVDVHLERLRDLRIRRLAATGLAQGTPRALEFVQRLDDVDGQPDRPAVVSNSAADGLPNPPGRVGREPEAPPELKTIDGLQQSDVAFLNKVEERQTASQITLRD